MWVARFVLAVGILAGSALAGAVWLAPLLQLGECQPASQVMARGDVPAVVPVAEPPRSPVVDSAASASDPSADAVAPALDSAVLDSLPADAPGLMIPVQGVRADQLVDTYTQSRSEGRRHDAIDIAAPRGTPVLAAGEGVVLKRFQSVRGGITLYQLAPDRATVYYYAHLDRYAPGIVEGRLLRRGEVLGYVGDSGNAGAGNYHLHFGVSMTADPTQYWGGVPLNPYPLLTGGRP